MSGRAIAALQSGWYDKHCELLLWFVLVTMTWKLFHLKCTRIYKMGCSQNDCATQTTNVYNIYIMYVIFNAYKDVMKLLLREREILISSWNQLLLCTPRREVFVCHFHFIQKDKYWVCAGFVYGVKFCWFYERVCPLVNIYYY